MVTMLAFGMAALVALIAIASGLTLLDCWIRGKYVFASLRAERALLDAGFVPMAPAGETRLRKPVTFETLAMPARPAPQMRDQRPAAPPLRSRQAAPGAA